MNSVFSKMLDALDIELFKLNQRRVVNPVHLNGSYEQKNVLLYLKKGTLLVGEKYNPLPEGGFYFVPEGQPLYAKFGKSSKYTTYGKEGFQSTLEREKHIAPLSIFSDTKDVEDSFVIIRFDVLIYNVISLFSILEMQGFTMPPNEELATVVQKMLEEDEQVRIGRNKMLNTLTEQMVVHLFRSIANQPNYDKFVDKIDYLLDKRLINIIKYIHDNLEKDLSNKAIASIAYVSEDYVGQFFKSLTNKNLQEYVEGQRLERAHYLLRTRSDIVQEIAYQVGFKDPAYFSRRFKLKYGINANVVRRKDSFSF
jgi:AraC family transcriptional regulator of arabinose operon